MFDKIASFALQVVYVCHTWSGFKYVWNVREVDLKDCSMVQRRRQQLPLLKWQLHLRTSSAIQQPQGDGPSKMGWEALEVCLVWAG